LRDWRENELPERSTGVYDAGRFAALIGREVLRRGADQY
jgi:hypothetical protein